ncbi:MAG TPA: alpha/beta hydrolase [Rhabdochlamydiaceae bacterium]|jgi:esterase FrsA|nr:alpha/beta hydrolase [Rhabdochlamydiaceae bacterium]
MWTVSKSEFLGPPLDSGPLPAVFYFALSAHDSLHLDPYNQPAVYLSSPSLRIFSVTLPGHDILPPTEALRFWAQEIHQGRDVIQMFVQEVTAYIRHLIQERVVDPKKIGMMGLSRGAFIAAHAAAALPETSHLLGFAPLTRLENAKEFKDLDVEKWDLSRLTSKLYNRAVRFYIGNRDKRVRTDSCFQFISTLADTAFEHKISSSPIELIIGPSIGHKGHGTSSEVFRHGASWLEKKLLGGAHG